MEGHFKNDKVIGINLIKEYKDNCPDLEASYCCEKAVTSCPADASWSEWSSIGKITLFNILWIIKYGLMS